MQVSTSKTFFTAYTIFIFHFYTFSKFCFFKKYFPTISQFRPSTTVFSKFSRKIKFYSGQVISSLIMSQRYSKLILLAFLSHSFYFQTTRTTKKEKTPPRPFSTSTVLIILILSLFLFLSQSISHFKKTLFLAF